MATALLLSMVAAYYSIAGLTAIFAAAVIPVIIMGASLELGKIVATVWLHNNWKRINWVFKTYLVPAVLFLMLLTSMGIFGFLSKAHSDQSLVSGDAMSKVAIYDDKIATEKGNIDANKKALTQMDAQVDQMLGRSDTERGAERAVAIRKNQAKERASLQAEINKSQKIIQKLQEERAPIAAEFRKVEAEVGPIKYIAALLYGDNPDQNVLEKAVRWVIILIVIVFDPLALCLILAANKQIEWARHGKGDFMYREEEKTIVEEPAIAIVPPEEIPDITIRQFTPEEIIALDQEFSKVIIPEPIVEESEMTSDLADLQYQSIDSKPFIEIEEFPKGLLPEHLYQEPLEVEPTDITEEISEDDTEDESDVQVTVDSDLTVDADFDPENFPFPMERPVEGNAKIIPNELTEVEDPVEPDPIADEVTSSKEAYKKVSHDYVEYEGKVMSQHVLKDMHPEFFSLTEDYDEDYTDVGFGTKFPEFAVMGDMFIRIDVSPNRVFKFNGTKWIEVKKELSDTYLFNKKYIEYLITKIGTGEFDPELLTAAEQEMVQQYIKNPNQKM